MEGKFEIYITDLKPKVQKDLMRFLGIKSTEEGDYHSVPITILPKPE